MLNTLLETPATEKRHKANEILHNLSSCNTRSINEVVSRAILHKWQLVQLMIDDYKHLTIIL